MSVILHIEDDASHAFLTARALKNISAEFEVKLLTDGQLAVDYLKQTSSNGGGNSHLPALILLDLNLPKLHGLEVLKTIKGNPDLCQLPVVILTTSDSETDRRLCREHCADDFLTKPGDYSELVASLHEKVETFLSHKTDDNKAGSSDILR